jgi:oligosaccharyltransferase complex subunit gamma
MKLSTLLAASFLFGNNIAVAAGKKKASDASSADRFQTYHRRLSPSPLELDDKAFDHLTAPPRDYSVAVILTAGEAKYGCAMCRAFAPEWDLLARSWGKGDKKGEARLLFGTLDFAKGKNTFQKVRFSSTVVKKACLPTTID